MKKTTLSVVLATSLFFVGCGDDTTTATPVADETTTPSTSITGYFVDAAVTNLDYDCIADNDLNKITLENGAFTCQDMSKVQFRIGNLVLGEINALPSDAYVFPQDIVGVDRTDIYNEKVSEIAKVLQSCDSDGNATNGITIDDATKELVSETLETLTVFDENSTELYLSTIPQEDVIDTTSAQAHLHATLQTLQTTNTVQAGTANHQIIDLNTTPLSTLTDEVKETIKFMINEEKLAYDVYIDLYNYHLENSNTSLFQLKNTAERSETTHIQLVVDLATKYGIEENAQNLENGSYTNEHVQGLYDMLYGMGQASPIDALKAGCIVEVVDINDLNRDIEIASTANVQDAVDVFTVLRDGSYNHYWSFDSGLKSMNVADGCCSLGTIDGVNYCQADYPQNTNGNQNTNTNGNRR